MKKILLLIAILLASSGIAKADYYYTTTVKEFSIKDESYGSNYCYHLDITNQSAVSSDGTYKNTATIYLYPKAHTLEGVYTPGDGTMDEYSYIYYASGGSYKTRYVMDTSSRPTELTISANEDGTYTIGGIIWVTASYSGTTRYYKYTYNDFIYDPFSSEPSKTEININAEEIKAYDLIYNKGYVELDLNTTDGPYAVLGFKSSTFNIPAGTYSLDASGDDGTFMASTGKDGNYAIPSYVETLGWPADDYFLRSGSITVSYSNGNMIVNGSATSAHGSTISLKATAKSPFEAEPEPEPETYTLSVTSITPKVADKYFELQVKSTLDEDPCNCFIRINSETLVGEYDYQDFYTWCKAGDWYLDTNSTEHTLSIVSTGNENEYKLNFTIYCEDRNIYKVVDAIFTYVPPTPFDLEPEASSFTFALEANPEVINMGNVTALSFCDSNNDELSIAFPVSSKDKIAAGTYSIATTNEEGTVIASPGCIDDVYQPTYIAFGEGLHDSTPYFLTSGTVNVAYNDGKIFITGNVTSAKGSEITLNVSGLSPLEEEELPDNAFSGYLLGTGMNYFLAYDVTTNSNHTVTVSATLVLDEAVLALQPQVVIGTDTFDMSYDDTTGACEFTTTASYSKGNEIEISFNLHRSNTNVATDSFKYTVE